MAENSSATIKWAITTGVAIGSVVVLFSANLISGSYERLSLRIDDAIQRVETNTNAITEIRGYDVNLAWRLAELEDQSCKVEREVEEHVKAHN